MLVPGLRTVDTTSAPSLNVLGTFGPASTTRPRPSCPVIRKSWPSGASPYSAALISLSVASTPTRRTLTSTPRPSGISATSGSSTSRRCIELGAPGWTATAFIESVPPWFGTANRVQPYRVARPRERYTAWLPPPPPCDTRQAREHRLGLVGELSPGDSD